MRKLYKKATFQLSVMLMGLLLSAPAAFAGASTSSATEWQSLWDTIVNLLRGYPGIIAAAFFILSALVNLYQGRLGGAVVSIVVAAGIFVVPTIASGMALAF
ncbi:hypothetical protein [Desulfurobacterium sp.]